MEPSYRHRIRSEAAHSGLWLRGEHTALGGVGDDNGAPIWEVKVNLVHTEYTGLSPFSLSQTRVTGLRLTRHMIYETASHSSHYPSKTAVTGVDQTPDDSRTIA